MEDEEDQWTGAVGEIIRRVEDTMKLEDECVAYENGEGSKSWREIEEGGARDGDEQKRHASNQKQQERRSIRYI